MSFDCSKFDVIGRISVIGIKRLPKHVETGHFRNHGTDQCFAERLGIKYRGLEEHSDYDPYSFTLFSLPFYYRLHLLLRWFHNARSVFDLCIS